MGCPYCPVRDPAAKILFANALVLFMQNARVQGALKHSGVIIPVEHRETVFDLTEEEILATFQLLAEVKKWMDARVAPDGYNVEWNCGVTGGQHGVSHENYHR